MDIIIKSEFNNGVFDCLEIYHDTNKILETTNNNLWNATEKEPIAIAKTRLNDYVVSDVLLDPEEETDKDIVVEVEPELELEQEVEEEMENDYE